MAAEFTLNYFIPAEQVAEIFDLMAHARDRVFCDFFFHALNHALEQRRISALDFKEVKGAEQPLLDRRAGFELGRKIGLTFSGDNISKIAALASNGKYAGDSQWLADAVTNYTDYIKARPGFVARGICAGSQPS